MLETRKTSSYQCEDWGCDAWSAVEYSTYSWKPSCTRPLWKLLRLNTQNTTTTTKKAAILLLLFFQIAQWIKTIYYYYNYYYYVMCHICKTNTVMITYLVKDFDWRKEREQRTLALWTHKNYYYYSFWYKSRGLLWSSATKFSLFSLLSFWMTTLIIIYHKLFI